MPLPPTDTARTLIHLLGATGWGGAGRYALDICRHFRLQGWKVRIVTRDIRDIDTRISAAGVSVRHAPLRDYPDIFSAMMLRGMLRAIPRGEGIVHVHSVPDALTAVMARRLARRPDIRIVATRHSAGRSDRHRMLRGVCRHIDSWIFVSEFSRARFLSSLPDDIRKSLEGKTCVGYNSLYIPDEVVVPEPAKGPVVAMYHGGLAPGRGLETLIDAMSLLRDTRLRLRIAGGGDPDYTDRLRRHAQNRGVMEKIDWVRRYEDTAPLVAESHFGVFPVMSPEACGLSNLEFMAMGRPQVSTLLGGPSEYLTDGVEALAVKPADAGALAEAMRRLAEDPDLRAKMGAAARERYMRDFAWHRFIARLGRSYALTQ